jgi:hypothetical protein
MPNAHKISVALEEMEVPYTVKLVNISKGEQRRPDFLRISPNRGLAGIRKYLKLKIFMITLNGKLGEAPCRRRRHRRFQAGSREMSCVAMVRIMS